MCLAYYVNPHVLILQNVRSWLLFLSLNMRSYCRASWRAVVHNAYSAVYSRRRSSLCASNPGCSVVTAQKEFEKAWHSGGVPYSVRCTLYRSVQRSSTQCVLDNACHGTVKTSYLVRLLQHNGRALTLTLSVDAYTHAKLSTTKDSHWLASYLAIAFPK